MPDTPADDLLARAQGALADSQEGHICICEDNFTCAKCTNSELIKDIEQYFTDNFEERKNGTS